ncbi:MAG: GMP reductase, partial [Candidatus Izemoplasmataceae bacterium]
MRIEFDDKFDFSDVLIRPKRSTLSSRKEVDLNRTYTFKHSKEVWKGIPIMAANMDGVGTINMAKALQEHKLFTCLVKSYDANTITETMTTLDANHFAVSTGTSQYDFDNLTKVL